MPLPICPRPGVEASLLPPHSGESRFPFPPLLPASLPFPLTPFPPTVAGSFTAPGPFLSLVPMHHLPHPPHHCPQHEDAWSWSTLCLHSPRSSLAIPPPPPPTHTHILCCDHTKLIFMPKASFLEGLLVDCSSAHGLMMAAPAAGPAAFHWALSSSSVRSLEGTSSRRPSLTPEALPVTALCASQSTLTTSSSDCGHPGLLSRSLFR